MESLSLLKYWRGGGGKAEAVASANMPTTTIAESVLRPTEETDDTEDDDEGPFFDLEFPVPDDGSDEEELGIIAGGENDESAVNWEAEDEDEEEEGEFKFAVSPDGHSSDPSLSLSPSDDLFFKGRLVQLEPTNALAVTAAETDSKPPQFPVSLLRSATKLRVRMLRFRKPKSAPAESGDAPAAPSKQQQQMSKFFVKFKVEEVPIVSLFTRDNSSRTTGRAEKPHAQDPTPPPTAEATEERRFSKEAVQKYINKIKPLYVRVSKRYGEKLRFSGLLTPDGVVGKDEKEQTDGETEAPAGGGVKNQKTIVPAGLRVACKRLGKSRSAPSAVAAAPPPPPPPPPPQRRDDSLLQQQDGIQSAIAHCKRSFNAARGSEPPLVRSMSDPGDGERSEKEEDKESLLSNPSIL